MRAHLESEKSILGAMFKSATAVTKAIDRLMPEDFASNEYREVFSAMLTVALGAGNVDLTTVDAELTRAGKLEAIGGAQKLIEISRSVPSAANVDAYIDIVLEKSNLRRLQAMGKSIYNKATVEELTADQIIELIDGSCNDITTRAMKRDKGWLNGGDTSMLAFEAAEKGEKHVPTGFRELDDMMCGGLVRPELTIVGARPGKGKSAFLLTVSMNAARAGANVGYFSLEMSATQLGQRMLSAISMVGVTRMRTGELTESDWERMNNALSEVSESGINERLRFYEGYGLTVERLANIARHAVQRGEMDLMVIDYIQLLRTTEKTSAEYERLGTISKALKQLALALNIPILTAAQVRRQSQDDSKKGGRAPTLDELRGSGDLEQDADNVLLIHSPDSPDDPVIKRLDPSDARVREMRPKHMGIWERSQNAMAKPFTVEIAKQRQGPVGRTWCLFKAMNMRFYEDKEGVQNDTQN